MAQDKVDPIHQFHISDIITLGEIGTQKLALTNSGLFMLIVTATITLFLTLSTRGRTLVPGRAQLLAEMSYEFVANMVRSTAGTEGMRFFPLVFSLFMFVLFSNLIGMVPYFFTVTSHVSVTFSLAMLVMIVVVGYGLAKHGLKFLNLFLPSGIPAPLVPLIVLIEIISFISRPLSLSMRLFGNMLGGHIAMKVIASFIVGLASVNFLGVIGASLPIILLVALTALEFLVAFLQAYVFAVLTCVYLNDALHPSH